MHYERALPGSDDRAYAYVYKVLRRRAELNRQDSSRKALLSHHVGGGNALAMAAGQKGGKGTKAKNDGNGAQTRKEPPGPRVVARERGTTLQPVCVFSGGPGVAPRRTASGSIAPSPTRVKSGNGRKSGLLSGVQRTTETTRIDRRPAQVLRAGKLSVRCVVPLPSRSSCRGRVCLGREGCADGEEETRPRSRKPKGSGTAPAAPVVANAITALRLRQVFVPSLRG